MYDVLSLRCFSVYCLCGMLSYYCSVVSLQHGCAGRLRPLRRLWIHPDQCGQVSESSLCERERLCLIQELHRCSAVFQAPGTPPSAGGRSEEASLGSVSFGVHEHIWGQLGLWVSCVQSWYTVLYGGPEGTPWWCLALLHLWWLCQCNLQTTLN